MNNTKNQSSSTETSEQTEGIVLKDEHLANGEQKENREDKNYQNDFDTTKDKQRHSIKDDDLTARAIPVGNTDIHTVNKPITFEYNRKNYDSPKMHQQVKNEAFGDKKTTIDVTGEKVLSSSKSAQNRYKSNAPKHQAEADHIDPIKDIHNRSKHNAYLSDEDIKEIANRKKNYQILNKSANTQKGADSEIKAGIKSKDWKRVKEGVKARAETDVLLTEKTAVNVGKQALASAPQAAATALCTMICSTVRVLPELMSGEMSEKEVAKTIAKTGAKSFAVFEGYSIALPQINHLLINSGNSLLQNVGKSGTAGIIITSAVMVASSSIRLASGEISPNEYAKELLTSAASVLTSIAATALLGPGLGQVATISLSLIVSAAQKIIAENASINEEHEKRMEFLQALADAGKEHIGNKSAELDKLMCEKQSKWDTAMAIAFKNISDGIIADDPKTLNSGISIIMQNMDIDPIFSNAAEFRSFMDSPNRKIII